MFHDVNYFYTRGQCRLLFETNQTIIFGHRLNLGDIYGDDSLQSTSHNHHRLNGLITNEVNRCSLIGFFSRDVRVSWKRKMSLNDSFLLK